MKISYISTSAAILLLGGHVRAGVVGPAAGQGPPVPDLAQMLKRFQEKGQGLIPDNPLDNLRFDKTCLVSMETKNGAHCYASVFCADGDIREYNKERHGWNSCFVGGRQFFNDPRIGEFSIQFVERDGFEQGQGLTTPILQVKNIGDWLEIPVEGVARERRKKQKCDGHHDHSPGKDCGQGPMPCTRNENSGDPRPFAKQITKMWQCAIPYKV